MAEDAIQEACKRALMWHTSFDNTKTFDKWFNSILNNSLRDLLAEEKRGGTKIEYKDWQDTRIAPEKKVSDILTQVEEDIAQLPDDKREVATLYFLKGYTPREICKIVEMTNNSVRSFLKRYKQTLEEAYGT